MRQIYRAYKNSFLIVIFVFGVLTLYTINTDKAPRFILFLGRFHPLVLHLPIGALVVTFFIDIIGRIQKNYSAPAIQNLLGVTAFFSIITCFLGYFLSLEGGYEKTTLDVHFYTGILTAVLVSMLFFMSLRTSLRTHKTFLILFIMTLATVSVAGHYGSVLTHGEHFLTEYAKLPAKEKTIEVIDSLRIYENVVSKILNEKCVQCHNSSKQKGNLSLISEANILKGGKNGPAVVIGNVEKSSLYTRMLLPISEKKHMPPEGKEQLTKDEIWLVKHWIAQGADFKNYVRNTSENDTLRSILKKYLVFSKVEIPKASESDKETVTKAGFRVLELVPGAPELNVKYTGKTPTKKAINTLTLLQEQVVELDFHSAMIEDEMISVIKKLKNLKVLRINSERITDKALQNFKKLTHLKVLNLYNTRITGKGLERLLATIQPKKIYVWRTNVDGAKARQLEKEFNVEIQNVIAQGFAKKSQLGPPVISSHRTLFTDTIHVRATSRLKGVTLRYTLDGSTPDSSSMILTDKVIIDSSKTLKIGTFKKGWMPSEILVREYTKVQYRVISSRMKTQPDKRYPNPDKFFDMEEGSLDFRDGRWVGYYGNDLEATLDLGAVKKVTHISFNALEDVGSWILYPTHFKVYVSATSQGSFKRIGEVRISREGEGGAPELKKITLKIPETQARFFKIIIKNHKKLPSWHPSAGNPSWLFVDEIYFWE